MILSLLLAAALSVEDYATMPQIASPQWAPDGKRIAYVLTKADLERSVYDSDVWIIDADGGNDRRLTDGPGADFRPRWSPDGTHIAFVSDRAGRNAIFLADVATGEARQLTNEPTPVRELEWSPDGKRIAFTRIDEPTPDEEQRAKEKDDARVIGAGTKHVRLYVVDLGSGEVRRLTNGPARPAALVAAPRGDVRDDLAFDDFERRNAPGVSGFLADEAQSSESSVFTFSWSPDGAEIAYASGPSPGLDGLYRTDIYAVSMTGTVRPIVVRPGIDHGPAWSPDGKSIAFASGGGVDHWIVEHDVHIVAASGGAPRMISKDYDRTPERIAWSEDSRTLWIEGPWNTTTQLFRVDADGSGFTNVTKVEGVVADADLHGDRAAYVYQSLTEPPELYVVHRKDRRQLTHHNDAYRNFELGETRLIRWKNPKDGLEIEGLLTLPTGYEKGQRVPLLTFVHGGPASRFDQGFLGYLGHVYAPHALAANGFAVLRPNPRGTGGYGAKFRRANRVDWGGLDWIDINAGIDKVIADGIADPKRLGLMGWSYGGFIAAWALGHSDRFLAVSVGAPVVDLLSFHGTTDIRDFIPSYFDGTTLDVLRTHSPAWQLKKTNAKVLIQHGEADDRVPLSQGTLLYRLLDELDTDVTMVVYPRTPHVPREPKLRIDVARRNLEFFSRTFGVR
jgi:dipeptidyl aminopeptidase/acylaminoacyl peptidase